MKKLMKYVAVLGVAMTALACVNEPAEEVGPNTNLPAGAVVFEGVATDCSRTLLTPNADKGGVLTTSWVSADKVGIFESLTESVNVLYTPAEEGAQVHFTSTSPIAWKDESSEHSFYAYYPYSTEASGVEAVPFAVPATVSGALTDAAASDLLYASAKTTKVEGVSLNFAHALAVLEVRLSTANGTLAVASLEIVAEQGEKINGEGTLNLTNGELTIDNGSNITIVNGPAVISTTATTLYVPITPGHGGKTLAVVLNGEDVFKKVVPAAGLPAGSQAVIAIDGLVGESSDDTSATPTGTFDYAKLEATAHPRLLINADDLKVLKSTVQTNAVAKQFHETILARCEEILGEGDLSKALIYNRMTAVSEKALERILFLAYGYRMTNKADYLTQAEKDIVAVCSWDDWNGENWIIDVAELTTAVAVGYDWLHYDLKATTREAALEALVANAATLKSTTNNSTNAICNSAAVLAGLATYEKGKAAAATLIDGAVAANLASGFVPYDTYGAYNEGYDHWAHATTYEAILITALEKIFAADGGLYTKSTGLAGSATWALFMVGSSGKVFNYGDAQEEWEPKLPNWFFARKEGKVDLLYNEKQLYDKGAYKARFSEFRLLPTIFALMDASQATQTPAAPNAAAKSAYFMAEDGVSATGMPAVMILTPKSGDSYNSQAYIGIKGGRANTNRAQKDGGSFVYDYKGMRWVCDLGGGDEAAYDNQIGKFFWDYGTTSQRWNVARYNNYHHNVPNISGDGGTTWVPSHNNGKTFLDDTWKDSPWGTTGKYYTRWQLCGIEKEGSKANKYIVGIGADNMVRDYMFNDSKGNAVGYLTVYDKFQVQKACTYRWQIITPPEVAVTDMGTNLKLVQGGVEMRIKFVSANCKVVNNGTTTMMECADKTKMTMAPFVEALTGELAGYHRIGFQGDFVAGDQVYVQWQFK